MSTKLKPCPFCGSQNLSKAIWIVNDEEDDGVECIDCAAGAPLYIWNRRSHKNEKQAD